MTVNRKWSSSKQTEDHNSNQGNADCLGLHATYPYLASNAHRVAALFTQGAQVCGDLPEGRYGSILGRTEALQNAFPGVNDEVGDPSLLSHNLDEIT